ncbi:MAG TPA: hypothetical protein VMF06_06460 [Candidatus Limnocylindria bacterium]|nr:hypothetical protein [Candidatus Limnocylindria bacterium]
MAGIEVVFHRDHEGWEFSYRGVKFLSFLPALTLPSIAELDSILVTLESLKSEMRTRLRKGLSEWGDARLDDEESCSVNVQDHAADKSFTVSWSDGASWGDLGVAFIIRCSVIADESWGD